MLGLISEHNPLLPVLYWCEKWLYARANKLVFSMEGGKDYIVEKGWDSSNGGPIALDKVFHINNGVDLGEFMRLKQKYVLDDTDLQDDSTFKVVYIGAIRRFNNVKMLIDAAKLLMNNKSLKVFIYGDGDQRKELESYAEAHSISNVVFKQKFVEKRFIPSIVSRSSLNVINYHQSDIWRYGESQNKMFQYLASGRPICANISPSYSIITRYGCGIAESFESAEQYARAIAWFLDLPTDKYDALCRSAAASARDYDFNVLVDKLISLFE
jgi:glycosyltransferase involved in cell wall biosynthesis